MMQHLMNSVRSAAEQANQHVAQTKHGVVTSYDPANYAVQVQLQPDDVNTGWIPLKCGWIGNGWGLFCPPTIGDVVEVVFQEGDGGAPSAGWRFYNDVNRPLACPSGEFWIVHNSGSLLKFHNDGSVELTTQQDLNATVGRNANVAVAGNITSSATQWNHTGPLTVSGLITGQAGLTVSGGTGNTATITGNLSVNGSVTNNGKNIGSTHSHSGVQTGLGNTGAPI